MKSNSKGFRHVAEACRNSISGLRTSFIEEAAFRQICLAAAIGLPAAFLLAESWAERVLLILPIAIALIVELLNTALENVVDLASPEWHELAKKAKDAGSAAQFCAQMLILAVWLGYIIERFW